MTRGEKVCAFIEKYLRVPEGDLVGKPMRLAEFQRKFVLDVYDNPEGTRAAYLSIGRKNAKTALIAALLLAHLAGPEARQNSQIVSGARSREQAGQIWNYAAKMVRASPELSGRVREIPSSKKLIGLAKGVEYRALSADAKTNHGLSPVLAILDEVGQIRGPHDPFVEAITTSQGAYEDALLLAISTQAADDGDLFSIWLDDAIAANDPHTVVHLYTAPEGAALDDPSAWKAANPALGLFRSRSQLEREAVKAMRMPSEENTFRWLYLNQRISADSPFVSKSTWQSNGDAPIALDGRTAFGGLDLAQRRDLTAFVLVSEEDPMDVECHFWLPHEGLADRARLDRVPYDIWADAGYLHLSNGSSVDYADVARTIMEARERMDLRSVAFDPNMAQALWPCLESEGLGEVERESLFHKVAQSYAGMTSGIDEAQTLLLDAGVRHGNHPVLAWNAGNAVLIRGRASDQYILAKPRGADYRRIDGIVALCMAAGRRSEMVLEVAPVTPWDLDEDFRLEA